MLEHLCPKASALSRVQVSCCCFCVSLYAGVVLKTRKRTSQSADEARAEREVTDRGIMSTRLKRIRLLVRSTFSRSSEDPCVPKERAHAGRSERSERP
eukprot:73160-Rhodomonas_salina.2